jgi:hypothetical protein
VNFINSILEGMVTALGMFIMMTVLGFLSFLAMKKWIIKTITEVWSKVKEEGLKLNGVSVEGKFKTKKLFKKEEEE